MKERFDSEYIRSELKRISDHLETPLTVYLIGGGSMAFRNLKETTKDIDLVVTDGDALQQFRGGASGLKSRGTSGPSDHSKGPSAREKRVSEANE